MRKQVVTRMEHATALSAQRTPDNAVGMETGFQKYLIHIFVWTDFREF